MKTTQKKFWETLAGLAANPSKGFKFSESGGDKQVRQKRTGHCPVSAVANALLNRRRNCYGSGDYYGAALEIGLSVAFADSVAAAADTNSSRMSPTGTLLRLRRKLVKAIGLQNEKDW